MKVVTKNPVRLSYPALFQPRAGINGGDPKYGCTLLIPKTDTQTIQEIGAAYQAAMTEAVGGVWKGAQPPQPRMSYYDGDGVQASGEPWGAECKGHMVLRCSSGQKPQCVDEVGQPVLEASKLYAGCYVRASINFKGYDTVGTKGIGSYINAVMFAGDGEPFGEGVNAAEEFAAFIQPQGAIPFAQPVAPVMAQPVAPVMAQPVAPVMAQPVAPVAGTPTIPFMGIQ